MYSIGMLSAKEAAKQEAAEIKEPVMATGRQPNISMKPLHAAPEM